MSKLQLVKIAARTDAYGGAEYDIVTVEGGYMVSSGFSRYDHAREAAERIDATMLYERDHGADSLQTV